MNAVPPLLPPTSFDQTSEDRILMSNKLEATILTDGTATLSEGYLKDLVYPPINEDEAVTKEYVDATAEPHGSINEVQYNFNSVFGSDPTFTFDGSILSVSKMTDSILTIQDSKISNMKNPVNANDLSNKLYVDKYNKTLNPTSISVNSAFAYTATSMINGIIFRDSATLTNTVIIDRTASARNIIRSMSGNAIGTDVRFSLVNGRIDGTFHTGLIIKLIPGDNVICDTISIPENYVLNARLVILNRTFGSERVLLSIDNISWCNSYMTSFFNQIYWPNPSDQNFDVLVETTSTIVLSDLQTINSVALSTGDRVLVKNQGSPPYYSSVSNGIYVAQVGAWSRSTDLDLDSNAYNISVLSESTGSLYFSAPLVNPQTIDTDSIYFVEQNNQTAFSTNLPYKIKDSLIVPFNDITETTVDYVYTHEDIKKNFIIRNPSSDSNDTFEDIVSNRSLLNAGSFIIKNISSNNINIGSSVNWVYKPTSVVIGATSSGLFWINIDTNQAILNVIGLL